MEILCKKNPGPPVQQSESLLARRHAIAARGRLGMKIGQMVRGLQSLRAGQRDQPPALDGGRYEVMPDRMDQLPDRGQLP